MKRLLTIPALAALLAILPANTPVEPAEASAKPVRVFILAGQSNMEGKAQNKLLEHQAVAPETEELFAHLRKRDEWIVRDDVFIEYLGRRGGLTIGYGSRDRTGVELEFGTVMGDHFKEPVLLIKTAWGGHSLFRKFRSPSAGLPADADLQAELEKAQQKVRKDNEKNGRTDPLPEMEDIKAVYGSSYRAMLAEVEQTSLNYRKWFPELRSKKLELAGFVWFQGWNDQYGAEGEYESNMAHFIRDVRKDLKAPELPFVIGVMGQNGSKPAKGAMLIIQKAQLAMESMEEFRGNVKAVRTDELVDEAAEKLYPEWKERREEWERTGSDHPYHYLGSAIWHVRIGRAMAEAMLELMAD